MAKHEFGIMKSPPKIGQRFDEYEPEKYGCISVDDVYVEAVAEKLSGIELYWHSTDVIGEGLAYTGVTLIPPDKISSVIAVIDKYNEFKELKLLLQNALKENKFIIHYGI